MAVSEYKLPDVGEGLTEAEIVTWKVKVGDVIKVNDIVVEIETAKSLVELPSPYAGTVVAIHVPEGETVPVGTPMIAVSDGVEDAAEPASQPPGELGEIDMSNPAATGGGENQTLVGYGPKSGSALRRARRGPATAASAGGAATQLQVQGVFEQPGVQTTTEVVPADEPAVPAASVRESAPGQSRVLAKPPVRHLAKQLGVDLRQLTPSGAGGTITRADVESYRAGDPADTAPARPARTATGGERREPIKGVRKMMGQAMVDSAFTLPHVTEWITVDVTRTMEFVERLKGHRAFRDVKVSPLLVLARAACLAIRRTPEINAWWDQQAQEIVYKDYVNLGIAAATPRGLVVPNVKDAESLTLVELAGALGELTATAREGKTQPAEMAGGTFTITNVGVFGVDSGTPIINPGESAIVCFGAVRKQPWVVDGQIQVRDITTLALSFDHRFIDGALGSQFLADVASIMEDPAAALMF